MIDAARRVIGSSAMRYGDFRALWLATLLVGAAYVAESVALGWWLLERTDSPLVVGLGVALRSLPNFLLGVPGGALADRIDRRLLLRTTTFISGVNAAVLAVLALSGTLTVGSILLLTFLSGAMRSLGQTARQSYAFDIVGPSEVVGGMSLIALGQRAGGIGGALSAGLVLAESGAGAAYAAIAAGHVLSAACVLLAKTEGQAAPTDRPPLKQSLTEYWQEIGRNANLRVLVLLTAGVEVLGFSHQALMPSLARDVLDIGAGGLGLLNAFAALGGVLAVLALSFQGELKHKGRAFLVVLLLFGASLALLANSGYLAIAILAIILVSGLAALSDLLSQSLMQLAVANDLRGRAMGSWILAIGLGPVGHLQIGALAAVVGVTAALLANGLALMLLAGWALLAARQIRRL